MDLRQEPAVLWDLLSPKHCGMMLQTSIPVPSLSRKSLLWAHCILNSILSFGDETTKFCFRKVLWALRMYRPPTANIDNANIGYMNRRLRELRGRTGEAGIFRLFTISPGWLITISNLKLDPPNSLVNKTNSGLEAKRNYDLYTH